MFNIEDAQQNTLMVEKRVWRYGARRPLFGRVYGTTQRNTFFPEVFGEQMASKLDREATTTNQLGGGSNEVTDRSE